MRLTWRDGIATLATAAAVGFYGLWVTGTLPGSLSTRTAALVVFLIGFAACPTAAGDVYTETTPRRVPMWYVVAFSAIGGIALAAGATAMIFASDGMLATLVVAMVTLWFAATLRHAFGGRHPVRAGNPMDASAQGPHPTF